MSRWFRFYDDVLNDPKVQLLPAETFKSWVNLLCLASKNNGVLPSLDSVTFALRVTRDDAAKMLDELCSLGLLDPIEVRDAPMSYEPHNWGERQFKTDTKDPTAANRSKRYRDRKRDASHRDDRDAAVTVTATRTDTESDTDTEQTKKPRAIALGDWPADYREQFWSMWPNKVGKPAAMSKLEAVRKSGTTWAQLTAGLERYIRTKPPDRSWLNPATFLHQRRFEDEPAEIIPFRLPGNIDMDDICPPSIYRGVL